MAATKLFLALVAAFATTANGAITPSGTAVGGVYYYGSTTAVSVLVTDVGCTCYLAGKKDGFTSKFDDEDDLENYGFASQSCPAQTYTFTLPDAYWQLGFDCAGVKTLVNFKIDGVAPASTITPAAAYDPSPKDRASYVFTLGGTDYHGTTTILAGTSKTPNPAYDKNEKVVIAAENTAFTFKYKLDGSQETGWTTTTSPLTLTDQKPGTHCLEVLGTDLAGNEETHPATYCWTVETYNKNTGCTFGYSVNGAEMETTSHEFVKMKDLPDGSNTFTVMAADMYGNPTNDEAYNTFSWTVDTSKPQTSFATTGTWGETELPTSTKGTFSYSTDEAGSFFKYQVDDGAMVLAGTTAGTTATTSQVFPTGSFPSSKCAGSEHSFGVLAIDAVGNVGDMAVDAFTVEPINTYLTLSNGVSGDVVNGGTAVFSISAIVDQAAPASFSYQYKVDGGAWQTGKHFPKFGVKGLSEGDHTIRARAKDANGCHDPTPVSVSFTIDTTAPETTLNCPVSPSNLKEITVYGYVDDRSVDSDGTQYKLGEDGVYSTPGVPTVPCAGCPDNTFAVQLENLVEGSYTLFAKSTDMAGLTGEEASCTWVVDMGPPETMILTGPPTPQLLGSETHFRFACMENSCTFMYSVDGTGFVMTKEDTVAIDNLEEGVHTMQVYAIDAAGNADPTPAGYTWTIYGDAKYSGYCDTCSFNYKGATPKQFKPMSSDVLHAIPGPDPIVDPYADAEL